MRGRQRLLCTLPVVGALTLPLLTGCGRSSASPSVSSQATASSTQRPVRADVSASRVVQLDQRRLRAASYTPVEHITSRIAGNVAITIFHTVCAGSADGHCQAVQVFRGSDPTPIWTGHYAGVTALRATRNGFSVTSVRYAASDPLCCPSLKPLTETYLWNGKKFTPSNGPGSAVGQ